MRDVQWNRIIDALLTKKKIKAYDSKQDCDVAVILSGKYINPLVFPKNRILITSAREWGPIEFYENFFKPVLEEYYKEIYKIDTLQSLNAVLKLIKKVVDEAQES